MKTQDPKEEKLLEELETIFQRVAESEKSEAQDVRVESLQGYYESLQVAPDASLETIREKYEQQFDFWNRNRFVGDASFKENAEKKLAEITHAYEKILASRQREKGPGLAEPQMQISENPDLSVPDEETHHHFPWGKIFLGGMGFIVLILVVSFWPTLYHDQPIESGKRTGLVRKHRITDSMTNRGGEKMSHEPVSGEKSSAPPSPPAPVLPAQAPALSEEQPNPTAATKPEPAEGVKMAGGKETPAEKQARQDTKIIGYTIQVGAVRDLNMAKKFVETQKNSGLQVYWAEIRAKDQGVWYRVYLGRFANKAEAARFMKEKKIGDLFPESFIRKLS